MINVEDDNNYHVEGDSGSERNGISQESQILSYSNPAALEDHPHQLSALDIANAGKKRKAEGGLTNVSMKTVMRWRGKEGIDICCLLGATDTSTVEERAKAEEILNIAGQLLCILCAQSVSGNKKSVRRHQFKNAKHLTRLGEVAAGQPFPSTEAVMNIHVPLPYVPLDSVKATAYRGCNEAWEIIKNVEKANDFVGLTATLDSLGERASMRYLISNGCSCILFKKIYSWVLVIKNDHHL